MVGGRDGIEIGPDPGTYRRSLLHRRHLCPMSREASSSTSNLICAESAEELSFPGSGRAARGTILGGTAGEEG